MLRSALFSLGFAVLAANVAAQSVDVAGRVVDASTKAPVAGAAVKLAGARNAVLTNEDGRFLVRGVEVGRHALEVDHLAYGKRTQSIDVPRTATLSIEIRLDPRPLQVEGITVTVLSADERRARASIGVNGIAEERIEAAAVRGTRLPELIRQDLGLRVREGRFRTDDDRRPVSLCIESRRGNTRMAVVTRPGDPPYCDMLPVFVDGVKVGDPVEALRSINPSMLARIEYLTSAEASRLYGLSAGENGAILLITKRGK